MGIGTEEETPKAVAQSTDGVSLDAIPFHSTNLLTVLDETGLIRYESPAIERIFGYEQDELVGDQVVDYFHPEDRETVLEAFRSLVSSEEYTVEAVEYRHKLADGTYCWVESVGSANPTPEGYYVINTRDISDRKAREQQLIEANKRLDRFVEVLSHDLRNPLQVAQGRLELATQACECDHHPAIQQAHDRMERLIENLLALARNGESVSDLKPVALNSIVAECWQTVETGEATLEPATECIIYANHSRLQQLLENLIRNAVEHGPSDVTIKIEDLPDGFFVEDDGKGIPEVEQARIFDQGFSRGGGTGLGLSIVKQVCYAHGWTINVSNGTETGVRFEITGVDFVEREGGSA